MCYIMPWLTVKSPKDIELTFFPPKSRESNLKEVQTLVNNIKIAVNSEMYTKCNKNSFPYRLLNNLKVLVCTKFCDGDNFVNTFRHFHFGQDSHLKISHIASIYIYIYICMHT